MQVGTLSGDSSCSRVVESNTAITMSTRNNRGVKCNIVRRGCAHCCLPDCFADNIPTANCRITTGGEDTLRIQRKVRGVDTFSVGSELALGTEASIAQGVQAAHIVAVACDDVVGFRVDTHDCSGGRSVGHLPCLGRSTIKHLDSLVVST